MKKKTTTAKKYIALARVSSKAQEVEGFSLDTQVDLLYAYATKQGGEIVRMLRITETATKADERTQFKEMLAYAKKHADDLDGLLVCKIDRAARNLSDYGRLLELESAFGVPLIAVTQPTQDSPAGRMARGTLALMASYFTDQLSVDVKQGLARRVSEGWFPTQCPYGYESYRENGRSMVRVEPTEAGNVSEIFHAYAFQSKTIDGVIEKLEREGRTYTKAQPHWYRSKIHRILRDRSYIGDVKFHAGWVPGKHPPLVNHVTFDRVQELLGDKIYKPQELTYAGELITCGHCGRPITGEVVIKKASGKAYRYYRCTNYLAPGHPRIRLPEAKIDAQFVEHLKKIEQPEPIREWFRLAIKTRATHASDQSRSRAREIEELLDDVRRQQDRLLNLMLSGTLDEQAYRSKNTELRDRLGHLTRQLEAIDRRKDENAELAVKLFELSQGLKIKWFKSNRAGKRRMLDLICLNSVLNGVTLVISTRKPFNCLVEGLTLTESGVSGI